MSKYSPESTDSVVALTKKLNDDADIYCPVGSSGWRQSDIEILKRVDDVRVQSVLLSRLKSDLSSPSVDTSKLSDDEIAETAIPRNLNFSDMSLLQQSIDAYKDLVPDTPEPVPEPAPDPALDSPTA